MIMDRAYEGDETRQLVLNLAMTPGVPPKANRLVKWDYDRTIYKRRNEVERLFRRLKGYRLHLLKVRKARGDVPGVPKLRSYRRYE